ncbi:MAG: hypothetical protein ABIV06_02095, partial [Thermoanaerobaculia bacterium]
MFERRPGAEDSEEEATIRRLLNQAGERPDLPAATLAGIAAAARTSWQEQLAAPLGTRPAAERHWGGADRRRPLVPRFAWGIATAAVAAITVVSWWMAAGRSAGAVSARAARVYGWVLVEVPRAGTSELAEPVAIAAGDAVAVGSRLTTAGDGQPDAREAGGIAL